MTLPTARTLPPGHTYEAKGGPWVDYLERHPEMAAERAEVAHFDGVLFVRAQLRNGDANRFRWQPEERDYWTDADGEIRDCEDFALWKRAALHHDGWPLGALRIMVGKQFRGFWDRKGVAHAVLNLVTDRGDFIANIPPFSTEILPIEKAMAGFKRFEPWYRTGAGRDIEVLVGALKAA